ncbi:lipoprotein [Lentibacillus sp. L22]|uniref:lipoprotein n=1 Tax=Lentibacillus TaxID=175304 RepID=UPI0022B10EB5|nr:lipoprotein [Lentibacillus daqui]
MKKIGLLFVITFIFIVAGCSQNIEDEIIGTWESTDKDDECLEAENDKLTFEEDGTVIGVEDYNKYKIAESENEDFDYAVLSGDFSNSKRYKIKFDQDDNLWLVDEDDEEGFDSSVTCKMEKVNDK